MYWHVKWKDLQQSPNNGLSNMPRVSIKCPIQYHSWRFHRFVRVSDSHLTLSILLRVPCSFRLPLARFSSKVRLAERRQPSVATNLMQPTWCNHPDDLHITRLNYLKNTLNVNYLCLLSICSLIDDQIRGQIYKNISTLLSGKS